MASRRTLLASITIFFLIVAVASPASAQEFSVSISPNSGQVGDDVTVEGVGFEGESEVTISFDDKEVGRVETTFDGKFEYSFEIEATVAGGCHRVKIIGKVAATVGLAIGTVILIRHFRVQPKLELQPVMIANGILVKATGSGFSANSAAKLLVNGQETEVTFQGAEVTSWRTSSVGNFNVSFFLPTISPEERVVQVFDANGYSEQAIVPISKQVPPPPPPAPPRPPVVPISVWLIIAVAALLFIAVIALIVRLRRRV